MLNIVISKARYNLYYLSLAQTISEIQRHCYTSICCVQAIYICIVYIHLCRCDYVHLCIKDVSKYYAYMSNVQSHLLIHLPIILLTVDYATNCITNTTVTSSSPTGLCSSMVTWAGRLVITGILVLLTLTRRIKSWLAQAAGDLLSHTPIGICVANNTQLYTQYMYRLYRWVRGVHIYEYFSLKYITDK